MMDLTNAKESAPTPGRIGFSYVGFLFPSMLFISEHAVGKAQTRRLRPACKRARGARFAVNGFTLFVFARPLGAGRAGIRLLHAKETEESP